MKKVTKEDKTKNASDFLKIIAFFGKGSGSRIQCVRIQW